MPVGAGGMLWAISTALPSRSERTEPLPAGALERLREALARTDYLAIEDDPALRLEDRGADSHYTMVIDVGERHHELTLLGAKHAGDGYRRGTSVAPEEAARRALSEVWGEVLGWSNETLGHRRIVTEALEPE